VAFSYFARSVALQPDGKIVVAGSVSTTGGDFAVARYNSNGTLDSTFDLDGKVTTDLGSTADQAYGVTVQADGKILVVGSSGDSMAVVRYNSNGTLDSGFDSDGKLVRQFRIRDVARSVVVQTNGRIVVVGQSFEYSSSVYNHDFLVVRLLANGAQDNSFDGDGRTLTNFYRIDNATSVALQADGKIVVAGTIQDFSSGMFAIARYNTNGSLDTTFDTDGVRTDSFPYYGTQANDVVVQSDGKITVAGQSASYSALIRYNNNGSIDETFGTSGKVIGYSGQLKSVSQQSDGKLVVAGSSNGSFSVSRYQTNGSLDPTFSIDGRVFTSFGPSFDEASGMVLQNDGKIVVAGPSDRSIALARYKPDGSLDTSFSGDGKQTLDFAPNSYESKVTSIALQSDGKLVVAGSFRVLVDNYVFSDFAVARFNSDGTLDRSFSDDGIVITDFGGGVFDEAFAVTVQTDGKILVGGRTNDSLALARYNSDGTPDKSFDFDGRQSTRMGDNLVLITSIALQSDGKILAAGSLSSLYNSPNTRIVVVARYNSNGSLDRSFDADGIVTGWGNVQRFATDIAVQPDGGIVVSGGTENANGYGSYDTNFAVTRYLSTGALDQTFGSNGTRVANFGAQSVANQLVVQSDGRILLAGKAGDDFALARFNADGTPDSRFAGDGKVTTDLGTGSFGAASLIIQPNGRIVAAGSGQMSVNNTVDSDFALVRYRNDPVPEFSTAVTMSAAGGVVVKDQWTRDDSIEISRLNNQLVITDKTEDSNARISVSGIAGATGHGTKQVTIPLTTIEANSQPLTFNLLGGDDRVELNTNGDTGDVIPSTSLNLAFGTGVDSLALTQNTTANTWNISGPQHGTVVMGGLGTVVFSAIESAMGGDALDVFKLFNISVNEMKRLHGGGGMQDTVQVSRDANFRLFHDPLPLGDSRLLIDAAVDQTFDLSGIEIAILTGGASNNRIDAYDFPGTVTLNGGGGDDQLYGGKGNDQLAGNDGNDLLVGGDGNDTLNGGNGNDIMVGELGTDTLYGGAGSDLVMGGHITYLNYYAGQESRDAILAAWFGPGTYAERVSALSTGVGPNNAYRLEKNYSVFDDFVVDTLFGGADDDWFFAKTNGTGNEIGLPVGGVRDRTAAETLTEL
jgi:uncharacterized delta-60 repeat protein